MTSSDRPAVLGLLGVACLLASCGGGDALAKVDGRPTVLRFCFTSSSEEPDAANRRLEVTQRYLERTLRMKVEAVKTTAYGAVIEAFRSNKIDVASISPFSYILATEKAPIEAIVMRGPKDGSVGEYSGVLAVPGNSSIQSIDDVIKHAKDLTISFVDPASASGFLVQNAYLQSVGLEPQRDFKKVVFSMSHPASLLTLKAGKVDVAATALKMADLYMENGKLARGDVRVIWTSPNIPNQPIAVRKDLSPEFKAEIQKAFLDMPEKDPDAFANQYPKTFPVPPGTVYVPANDAMFDGLRKMARGVKNLSLLEH